MNSQIIITGFLIFLFISIFFFLTEGNQKAFKAEKSELITFQEEFTDQDDMILVKYIPQTNIRSKYFVSYRLLKNQKIMNEMNILEFDNVSITNPIEIEIVKETGSLYQITTVIKDNCARTILNSTMNLSR